MLCLPLARCCTSILDMRPDFGMRERHKDERIVAISRGVVYPTYPTAASWPCLPRHELDRKDLSPRIWMTAKTKSVHKTKPDDQVRRY